VINGCNLSEIRSREVHLVPAPERPSIYDGVVFYFEVNWFGGFWFETLLAVTLAFLSYDIAGLIKMYQYGYF
jgi:hypothetical protein